MKMINPGMGRTIFQRVIAHFGLILYCIAIFLALDFGYSIFFNSENSPRIASAQFSHGLAANFDGYARFGEFRYRFLTNSLGFRDRVVHEVPLKSTSHRVLLMGDSFVEGMSVSFEESFAGLLDAAGRARLKPIEFLNAAVASYSPTLYYRKVKYLLEAGMSFDEVVVFSDISDVQDEATTYFCYDDDPQYRRYCGAPLPVSTGITRADRRLESYFIVTDATRMFIKYRLQLLLGHQVEKSLSLDKRAGWTIAGYDIGDSYGPLGVEGGITRSIKNMQALADLLRERGIPLTIVVYPWPLQLSMDDRNSRQAAMWREFCVKNCKNFIDLFPVFFAEKDAHPDWYKRLFIYRDSHFSVAGNRFVFGEIAKTLLAGD
jgi:hypothetical protein